MQVVDERGKKTYNSNYPIHRQHILQARQKLDCEEINGFGATRENIVDNVFVFLLRYIPIHKGNSIFDDGRMSGR